MIINIRTDCSCKTSAAALKTGHARNGDADHSTASTGYAPAAMSNQSFRPVPEQDKGWRQEWAVQLPLQQAPQASSSPADTPPTSSTGLDRFVSTALSNVTNALLYMPHGTEHGKRIASILGHAGRHPQAVCDFFEALIPHITIDFRHKVTGVRLTYGSAAWKQRINTAFNAMQTSLMHAEFRERIWHRSFANHRASFPRELIAPLAGDRHGGTASSCVSGLLVHELVAFVLPALVSEFATGACGVTDSASDVTGTATAVLDTVTGSVVDSAVPIMLAHDQLETTVLAYITGWALRSVSSAGFAADMATAVTQLLARLQYGYGPMLPQDIHVGPAVRLTRPCESLCSFVLRLEDFIRHCIFNPRTLLQYGPDVYKRGMTTLATSALVRTLWETCIATANHSLAGDGVAGDGVAGDGVDGVAGDGVAEPFVASAEVKVAVLEAFVRAYMLSRTKTFRDISGLMPEGTQSSLIFITS